MAPTKASDSCKRTLFLPPLPNLRPPPICLSFFQVCCTRGGKDRIYHLSAFGSPELRDAGQHKIIIHRHEITKPPGDPTTKLFIFFSSPKNTKKYIFSRLFFFDRQRDAGLDMMKKKRMEKGHFGETVLHTWYDKKRFWNSCDLCSE